MTGAVFVTGGSGFLGGAVVRRLVEQDREVRALARSDAAASIVSTLGATPVRGDLDDAEAMSRGLRGCDLAFHAAGVVRLCPRDPTAMYHANVAGPELVLRAAAKAGVPRVVLTSSVAAIGEPEGVIADERTPHAGTYLSAYAHSKHLGEQRAFRAARELGIELVAVNPSSVQGPGRTGGTARLLIAYAHARVAVLVRTWLSIVDVEDVATGHVLAAERGEPGERYLLAPPAIYTERAVDLLRTLTGFPRRVVWIPRGGLGALAGSSSLIRWASRSDDPSICPASIRTVLHGHRFDGTRATRELGLTYTSLRETLERTLDWYRSRGLLPAA